MPRKLLVSECIVAGGKELDTKCWSTGRPSSDGNGKGEYCQHLFRQPWNEACLPSRAHWDIVAVDIRLCSYLATQAQPGAKRELEACDVEVAPEVAESKLVRSSTATA